jgi:hypothetical protein
MTQSWRLKLDRAKHHMSDLDALMRPYEASRPYTAERVVKITKDQTVWRYLLRIDDQPDPQIAILVGDFIHNVRSALDHIAVAIAPPNRFGSAGFPICEKDLWETDADGNFVISDNQARESFESRVKGINTAAVALIKGAQPYTNARDDVPAHPFFAMNRLENADKHRTLIALGAGVLDGRTRVTARGFTLEQDAFGFRDDGAEIAKFRPDGPGLTNLVEAEVKVKITGPTKISFHAGRGRGLTKYAAREVLEAIFACTEDAIDALEPFVRS